MLAATLIVLVIGQGRTDASTKALERSMRGVLGPNAELQIESVAADPPDEESAARGAHADGVVELIWARDGTSARIHCYLSREQRFIDRQISFGNAVASPEREATERGRLLGFAVATMFLDATEPERAESNEAAPEPPREVIPATPAAPATPAIPARPADADREEPLRPVHAPSRSTLEFAGIASTGLPMSEPAGGLGASVALRLRWVGPLSGRLMLSGRSGNIRAAQASTRTAMAGGGLAVDFLPNSARFQLGLRLDAFASYFDATHLSEDDAEPSAKSRWLGGSDLVAEAGFRFNDSVGAFLGSGIEAVFGRTDIYTHGIRVATVPPLRIVGELGLRTHF